MGEIDLDAKRQARLEAQAEERSFRFQGERFILPPELSWDATELALELHSTGNPDLLTPALEAIIGTEEWPRFKATGPALADINELVGALLQEYGLAVIAPEADNGDGEGAGVELNPKLQPSTAQ